MPHVRFSWFVKNGSGGNEVGRPIDLSEVDSITSFRSVPISVGVAARVVRFRSGRTISERWSDPC